MRELIRFLQQNPILLLLILAYVVPALLGALGRWLQRMAARRRAESQGAKIEHPGRREAPAAGTRPPRAPEPLDEEAIAREIRRMMGGEAEEPAPAPQPEPPRSREARARSHDERVSYDARARDEERAEASRSPEPGEGDRAESRPVGAGLGDLETGARRFATLQSTIGTPMRQPPHSGMSEAMAARGAMSAGAQRVVRGGRLSSRFRHMLDDPAATIVAAEILGPPPGLRGPREHGSET
ncbi:MAG: hypothetical protein IT458_03850 [Planctomycetes bacterium]|nr:hypothetical protein [Planctomycetota bacterium]